MSEDAPKKAPETPTGMKLGLVRAFDPSKVPVTPMKPPPPEQEAKVLETAENTGYGQRIGTKPPEVAPAPEPAAPVAVAAPRQQAATSTLPAQPKLGDRRRKAGRSAAFNVRLRPDTVDEIHNLYDEMGCSILAEVIEHAVAALREKRNEEARKGRGRGS